MVKRQVQVSAATEEVARFAWGLGVRMFVSPVLFVCAACGCGVCVYACALVTSCPVTREQLYLEGEELFLE